RWFIAGSSMRGGGHGASIAHAETTRDCHHEPSRWVYSSLVLAGLHKLLQGSDLIRRAAHHRGDAHAAADDFPVLAVGLLQYVLGALAAVSHDSQLEFRVEVLPTPYLIAPGLADEAVGGHHEVDRGAQFGVADPCGGGIDRDLGVPEPP